MKIAVTGGRDFTKVRMVQGALAYCTERGAQLFNQDFPMSPITHIIHGGAKGVDTMAGTWAKEHGVQEVVCPANWAWFDKPAGYIRNTWMLDLLDPHTDFLCLFPGGKGTQDCLNKAVELGINVYRYYYDYENEEILQRMMRIAYGEETPENQEVADANGEAIPEPNPPVRGLPINVGNGVFGARPVF